ncbi:isoprenylcysteine carboxylmethyltransferase family protein [Georgenia phoenicis]|uniref:methyltransferase family protein n=1 Tax=unclassified Georgenia TaxID=2626815 RepID=UPI002D771E7E|nr:isoprenylcysteine carboxylmethyltransferase family protein [Georgenia sp. H159]
MTADVAAAAALTLYLAGLVAAFGARSWIHRRRTGSTGFRGLSGAPGSAEWWGGILFAAALALGAAGPALALTGTTAPITPPPAVQWAGLAVAIAGFAAVLAAQAGMGASWRIGVDTTERTGLVTSGMFAVVRNPIFTAMLTALLGLTVLVPTALTAAALACLLLAVEIQVRLVEEPYLLRTHGPAYARYAQRVGRFLPGLGTLAPHTS